MQQSGEYYTFLAKKARNFQCPGPRALVAAAGARFRRARRSALLALRACVARRRSTTSRPSPTDAARSAGHDARTRLAHDRARRPRHHRLPERRRRRGLDDRGPATSRGPRRRQGPHRAAGTARGDPVRAPPATRASCGARSAAAAIPSTCRRARSRPSRPSARRSALRRRRAARRRDRARCSLIARRVAALLARASPARGLARHVDRDRRACSSVALRRALDRPRRRRPDLGRGRQLGGRPQLRHQSALARLPRALVDLELRAPAGDEVPRRHRRAVRRRLRPGARALGDLDRRSAARCSCRSARGSTRCASACSPAAIAALLPPLVAHGQIVGHESPTVLWWSLAILLALGVARRSERAPHARARLAWSASSLGLAVASRFVNGLARSAVLAIVDHQRAQRTAPRAALVEAPRDAARSRSSRSTRVWPRLWLHPIARCARRSRSSSQPHALEPFLGALTNHPGPHYFLVYLARDAAARLILARRRSRTSCARAASATARALDHARVVRRPARRRRSRRCARTACAT